MEVTTSQPEWYIPCVVDARHFFYNRQIFSHILCPMAVTVEADKFTNYFLLNQFSISLIKSIRRLLQL